MVVVHEVLDDGSEVELPRMTISKAAANNSADTSAAASAAPSAHVTARATASAANHSTQIHSRQSALTERRSSTHAKMLTCKVPLPTPYEACARPTAIRLNRVDLDSHTTPSDDDDMSDHSCDNQVDAGAQRVPLLAKRAHRSDSMDSDGGLSSITSAWCPWNADGAAPKRSRRAWAQGAIPQPTWAPPPSPRVSPYKRKLSACDMPPVEEALEELKLDSKLSRTDPSSSGGTSGRVSPAASSTRARGRWSPGADEADRVEGGPLARPDSFLSAFTRRATASRSSPFAMPATPASAASAR